MHRGMLVVLATALMVATPSYAQNCNPNMIRSIADSRYELLNNGTEIQDTKTGLIWQRCSLGQTWDGISCTGTAAIYSWESALQSANGGWRVPNIKELDSIVEEACGNPSISAGFFPVTQISKYYWSSSTFVDNSFYAWVVYFSDGRNFAEFKIGDSGYVRLVRSGQ